MCLAIYKPAKCLPDMGALEEGFRCNSHGAGFAVAHDGKLTLYKGFFTFDAFRQAFEPFAEDQCAIHFRLATHGKRDQNNCHPFVVTTGLSVIHNGILPIKCNVSEDMSDTWHYNKLILRPMAKRDPDFFLRSDVRFMGEAAISGSKFVFLRADGEVGIWNEDDGLWEGGIWYSNRSHHKVVRSYWWDKPDDTRVPELEVHKPPAESEYRDFLTGEAAWAYDDMLQSGFSADELDQLIREEGTDSLIQLSEDAEDISCQQ